MRLEEFWWNLAIAVPNVFAVVANCIYLRHAVEPKGDHLPSRERTCSPRNDPRVYTHSYHNNATFKNITATARPWCGFSAETVRTSQAALWSRGSPDIADAAFLWCATGFSFVVLESSDRYWVEPRFPPNKGDIYTRSAREPVHRPLESVAGLALETSQ
jgi:hypothetical protein